MNGKMSTLISIMIFILFLLGCSGDDAVIPDSSNPSLDSITDQVTMNGQQLWGYWDITINPATGAVNVDILRNPTFTANVNNILEGSPGNLLIEDMDFTDFFTEGRIDCTVTLKHPLPGLDEYHGFDVWGVFMHNGSSTLNYDGLLYSDGSGADEAVLLNPDGWSRWFNYTEFNGNSVPIMEYWPGALSDLPDPSATLNPYKVFADGLNAEDDYHDWLTMSGNANDRGIYRAGAVNSRRYELKFPIIGDSPVVNFQYAVIASWEPGDPTLTGNPADYEPEDFPSSANCEEAFFLNASTTTSSLYYIDPGQAGGTFVGEIEVFDWQGGIAAGNGVPNEVERMIVEADFIPGGFHELNQAELISLANPSTENSSVFQVEILNCEPQSVGITDFWVIVEAAGLNGASYDQGFPTEFPDGAVRASFLKETVEVSSEPPYGLTSITPDTAPFWSYVDDAEIVGGGFEAGCSVELRKGTDTVVATDITIQSGSSILCDFDLTAADSGVWDVVVIYPDLSEAILAGGFTIDVWSEEVTLETGGNRLPQMAETSAGSAVLLVGCDDNNMRYFTFEEGVGFSTVDFAVTGNGGHWLMVMTSDPVTDYVYVASNLRLYRYTGASGLWDYRHSGLGSARAVGVNADINGKIHIYHNTNSAWGWIIHNRRSSWSGGWELTYDYLQDSWNTSLISEGHILTQNSSGMIFLAYERDFNLSPYYWQPGPRWVKACWIPVNGTAGWNLSIVDTATGLDPLDSPSIICDSNDILHYTYRRWVPSTGDWQVVYKKSTNSASSWGSESLIYEDASEPEDGYVFILCDSNDELHAIYNLEGEIEYKSSSDGASWSTAESVNPSASDLPPGTDDFTPRQLVTSDGIMHVTWIRGDSTTGYGDLRHRMRDLY